MPVALPALVEFFACNLIDGCVDVCLHGCGSAHLPQDVLLPYMADPRHIPDTIFFVLEEDWRLFERDEKVNSASVGKELFGRFGGGSGDSQEEKTYTREEVYAFYSAGAPGSGVPFAPSASSSPPPSPAGVPFAPAKTAVFEPQRPKKIQRGEKPELSPYLKELLDLTTFASRQNAGGFIWLSWDGFNRKGCKTKPMHALTMVSVTHRTAVDMLDHKHAFEKKHFDVALRNLLIQKDADWATRWRASYVFPSIGHYCSHQSGCEKDLFRESGWKNSWVQEGVRPAAGQQDRWLCSFRPGGEPWIAKIPFEKSDSLEWQTLEVEDTGAASGVPFAPGADPTRKEFGGDKVLQMGPQVEEQDFSGGTERRQRQIRQALSFYKFRNMTKVEAEAGAAGSA